MVHTVEDTSQQECLAGKELGQDWQLVEHMMAIGDLKLGIWAQAIKIQE